MAKKKTRRFGPEPKYGSRSSVVSVRMPGDLSEAIDAEAKRRGLTRSEIIIQTLKRVSKRWAA